MGTSVPGTSAPDVPIGPRPNQQCYLHLWCRFFYWCLSLTKIQQFPWCGLSASSSSYSPSLILGSFSITSQSHHQDLGNVLLTRFQHCKFFSFCFLHICAFAKVLLIPALQNISWSRLRILQPMRRKDQIIWDSRTQRAPLQKASESIKKHQKGSDTRTMTQRPPLQKALIWQMEVSILVILSLQKQILWVWGPVEWVLCWIQL